MQKKQKLNINVKYLGKETLILAIIPSENCHWELQGESIAIKV